MMFGIEKPLPNPSQDTEGYWEAARRGKLVVSECQACRHKFLPPATFCPTCWSEDVRFAEVSGRGRLYSFIVVHRPQHPAFFADAPYNVVIVELAEGPRMHARLTDCAQAELRVGLPVEVHFQKVDDEIYLPLFRPAGPAGKEA
jgi:uncharacterized OB-fold protein